MSSYVSLLWKSIVCTLAVFTFFVGSQFDLILWKIIKLAFTCMLILNFDASLFIRLAASFMYAISTCMNNNNLPKNLKKSHTGPHYTLFFNRVEWRSEIVQFLAFFHTALKEEWSGGETYYASFILYFSENYSLKFCEKKFEVSLP